MAKLTGNKGSIDVSQKGLVDIPGADPAQLLQANDSLQAGPAKRLKVGKKTGLDSDESAESTGDEAASGQDASSADSASTGGSSESMQLAAGPNASSAPTSGTPSAGAGEAAGAGEGAAAGTAAATSGSVGLLAAGLGAALAAGGGGGGSVAAAAAALAAVGGKVADGYVSGARLYVDANRDGVAQESEFVGLTDAAGNFSFTSSLTGPLIAIGGTNIDTGLPNTVILKAPAGSTQVNPLSTVLQEYSEANPGASLAAAQAAVKTALGLPAGIDLTTFDPLAAAPTDPTALAAQKVAAQIVAALALSGDNDAAVFDNIVSAIGLGNTLDLSNSTDLATIFSGVSGVDAAAVLAATTAINSATTLATSGPGSLSELQGAAYNDSDNTPIFISGMTGNVVENSSIGTAVYEAFAVDVEGGTVVYSLVDSAGGRFVIDPETGVVTVASVIDFEVDATLQFTVAATTDGHTFSTSVVTMTVGDVGDSLPFDVAFDASGLATVTVALSASATGWEYSTDGGETFVAGEGTSFQFDANSTDLTTLAGTLQVRELGGLGTENTATSEIGSLTVASDVCGDVFSASLNLDSGLGDISVLATDMNTSACADVYSSATVLLVDSDVVVEASGSCADALLTVGDAAGGIASLVVDASGYNSDANAYIATDGVVGDITVDASADYANAQANIVSSGDPGTLGLDGSTIVVTASGYTSSANLYAYSMSGNVDDISVLATGVSSDAHAVVGDGGGSVTLNGSDIEVSASSADAQASLMLTGAVGSIGSLTVEASATDTSADLSISGDGVGVSDIELTVTATGYGSNADLHLFGAAGSISSVNVNGAGVYSSANIEFGGDVSVGNISVTSGTSADAGASLSDLRGSGEINLVDSVVSVNASGFSSDANLSVYGATGTIASLGVSAGSHDTDANASICGDVAVGDITVHASGASADAGVSLYASGPSGDAPAIDLVDSVVSVNASGFSAEAGVTIGGATGSIESLEVRASGYSADAYASICGDVSVGDITVSASGQSAEANVNLYASGPSMDTPAIDLVDSMVSVGASGDMSSAHLNIYGATGSIASLDVSAYGSEVNTGVSICGDISVGSIHVVASGRSSDAGASLYASGPSAEIDLVDSTVSVNASGGSADAYLNVFGATGSIASLDVNAYGNEASASVRICGDITVGDISIFASEGASASADLSSSGSSMEVHLVDSEIDVTTDSSRSSDVQLNVRGATGSIASLNVIAGSTDAEAGASICGDVSVGDITVHATGRSADAGASLYASGPSGDTPVIDLVDSVVSVTASGHSAEATLHIGGATGSIESLEVSASGTSAEAHANISGDISVGDITVSASGNSAEASVSLYASGPSGDAPVIDLVDSVVSVTASGRSAEASLYISGATGSIESLEVNAYGNQTNASVDICGDITVGDISIYASEGGATASADLSASGSSSEISLNESEISVTASGTSAEAYLNIHGATGSIASLSVSADSTESSAEVGICGDLSVGDIAVHASGRSSDASAGLFSSGGSSMDAAAIDLVDSVVSVTASAGSAEASLFLGGATGSIESLDVSASSNDSDSTVTVYGDISVGNIDVYSSGDNANASADLNAWSATSSDMPAIDLLGSDIHVTATGSQDASATLTIDGATGGIASLGVSADSRESSAYAGICGDVSVRDIRVVASGYSSDASAYLNASGPSAEVNLFHSEISVRATNGSAEADLDIYGATGSIDSLNAEASGRNSSVDVQIQIGGTVGSITVSGSSADASANVRISGASADVTLTSSDISVHAYNNDSNAHLQIDDAAGSISSADVIASGFSADASTIIHGGEAGVDLTGAALRVGAYGDHASAGLEIDGAVGNVASLTIDASEGYLSSASADISVDGSIGQVSMYAVASSSDATATLLAFSVDDVDMQVGSGSQASLNLGLESHGGSISILDAVSGGNAYIHYLNGNTSDSIDLTAFSGGTHLSFDGADADLTSVSLDVAVDWTTLLDNALQIDDAGMMGFDLNFNSWTSGDYSENIVDTESMSQFQSDAMAALNGSNAFYFGVVDGNGYLAYDFDHSGVTGVIEMAGVTDFDESKIQNLIV